MANTLPLRKKVFFSLIVIAVFFLTLEISARVYHFVKYKNTSSFFYGKKFIINCIDSLKNRSSPSIYSYLRPEKQVDEIFEKRKTTSFPVQVEEPRIQNLLGYPGYINRFGYRNIEIELKKYPGTVRIMTAGGSFVMSSGVDDSSTWEYLLNEELKKLPGKYEVINGGRGGGDINDLLRFLISVDVKFEPDYLILFSAYNNHKLLNQEHRLSLGWRISSFFYNISQFYAMLREKISLILYKDNNYFIYNFEIKLKKRDADDLMGRYRKRLEQIYTVCGENNINLILGFQPEFIPNGLKNLQDLLNQQELSLIGEKLEKQNYLTYYEFEYYLQGRFNIEMKKFAEEKGIFLFDGINIFPKDKYPYFIDQIHLNQKGTAILAKALFSFLIKNNIAKTYE